MIETYSWSAAELENSFLLACEIAARPEAFGEAMRGKGVVLLFDMPSTRMRVSSEVAVRKLGAYPVYVQPASTHMGVAAFHEEVACLSRLCDALIVRASRHEDMEVARDTAACPVINARSDRHHPVQAIADLMAIRQRFGKATELTVAYVGPPNAVCNSLVDVFAKLGILVLLTRDAAVQMDAEPRSSAEASGMLSRVDEIDEMLDAANVLFLGTGTSMGPHQKLGTTLSRITEDTLESHPHLHLMHSMPAGDEVDPRALYHGRSLVFDQVPCKIPVIEALLVQATGKHGIGPARTFGDILRDRPRLP